MKKSSIYSIILSCCLFVVICQSCKKQDEFLDAPPRSNLAIPSTLKDLELMCNAEAPFNVSDPGFPNICAERYFISDVYYSSLQVQMQTGYLWAKDMQFNQTYTVTDWNAQYSKILTANTILEILERLKINPDEVTRANVVKGIALFYRSWAFFNLAREFAPVYDSSKAATLLGIPLRLSSDLEVNSVRASLKETYDRIINDLKLSISLLPATSANVTIPNNLVVKGALARIYLSIADYKNAFDMSDKFLQQFSTITDYNTLVPKNTVISSSLLSEDVYHTGMPNLTLTIAGSSQTQVDSTLYDSYQADDLRKTLFFATNAASGRRYFRGSYEVLRNSLYCGIATDEILLTRAECNARFGNNQAALDDLNKLLRLRYKAGKFTDYSVSGVSDVLGLILKEREKELFMRGQRWNDLRRLNKESGRETTLKRTINGVVYTLPPNDIRYVMPIPDQEILLSGIQQNPR